VLKLPDYILISMAFWFLIVFGFVYSFAFYPNKHPIACIIKTQTGKNCSSCGFSKAFSQYSKAEFKGGIETNPKSFPIFLFFTFQFILRSSVLFRYFTAHKKFKAQQIKLDIIISISFFLLAFLPLLFNF